MWDHVWEKVFTTQPWGRYPGEDLIRFVARNFYSRPVRAEARFLEVGFGTGTNLWFLAREGFSASGIEGSPAAAALARQRLDEECPGWDRRAPDTRLEVGDMARLPWPDGDFDALIDSEAVYCTDFEESRRIYAGMHRVARPGARLFVRTFATGSWGDGEGEMVGHRRYATLAGPLAGKGPSRFTDKEELPDLLGAWRIDEVNETTRTLDAGRRTIREWIVEAHKDQE